jgi:hypothetical protein
MKYFSGALTALMLVCNAASSQTLIARKHIEIKECLMPDALRMVAKTYETVIGLENVITAPFDRTITLRLDDASLPEALDALVKADPRFEWHFGKDGSIQVYGVDTRLTLPSIVLHEFKVQNMNRKEISDLLDRQEDVQSWLRQNTCERVEIFVAPHEKTTDRERISFDGSGKTLHENLDQVVQGMGTYFWEIGRLTGEECRISIMLPPKVRD